MTASDPASDEEAKTSAELAERLRAMGAVLNEVTSDESDDGWAQSAGGSDTRDAELRRQVPPHHGD